MYRKIPAVLLALAATAVLGCSDDLGPESDALVSIQDQCDPTSFNAVLGEGACTKQGNTTLAAFNAELAATQQVAGWRFVPNLFSVRTGQAISAFNDGGETHTFTEVAAFGGGIVPALNTASGNPVEAPECKALAAADFIKPGQSFRTDQASSVGTEYYQCCIHPWMRATVTVNN